MKRLSFVLALGALLAIPDNASAFFRCWWWGGPYRAYGPAFGYGAGFGYGYGRFAGSPYFYPAYPAYPAYPMPYFVVPATPVSPIQNSVAAPNAKAETPIAPPRAPIVTITPGDSNGVPKPKPEPAPTSAVEAVRGEAVPTPAPASLREPKTSIPIPDPMVPKSPPLSVPTPAPSSDSLPPIKLPELKKPDGKDDLPPIVLPPEVQGKRATGVVPSVSRSSPLSGAMKVQVFTAMGTVSGDLRKIGFFNHTDRDLDLVIAGTAVKLPKKSYLNANLPVKFVWKHSGGTETAVVPAGAAGLDVLFRD